MPIPLRRQLAELAGPGWDLDDDSLRDLWRRPPSDALLSGEGLPRRRRRDLQRALKEPFATQLRSLDVSVWREALLAQAAARAVDQGTLSLGDALRTLLAIWPETAELELAGGGDIAEALQLCAPARALLHRVGDSTRGALGLES